MTADQVIQGHELVEYRKRAAKQLADFKKKRADRMYSEQFSRDNQALIDLLKANDFGAGVILTADTLMVMATIAEAKLEARIVEFDAELEAL